MAVTRENGFDRDENRDPITGEPGAHPVGAGVGAAVGGAAAGAVIGGLAGGYAGKEVAEQIDPSVEDHHWRNEYTLSDYYDPMIGYDEVGPAYQYGWESRAEYGDRKWEDVEPDLAHDWTNRRGNSSLDWGRARPATRDAWDRVDRNFQRNPNDVTHPDPMEDRGVAGASRTPK